MSCTAEKTTVKNLQHTISVLQKDLINATGAEKLKLEKQLQDAEVKEIKAQQKLILCLEKHP